MLQIFKLPFPMISILLAVRNEEKNIIPCLQSLANLKYHTPIEILIGNDNSSDNSAQLIADFIADKPNFHLFHITTSKKYLQGKANVLAQLAHYAQGKWLFFTDADMIFQQNWVSAMLKNVNHTNSTQNIGVITGFTTVASPNSTLWSSLQALDWTFYLGIIQLCATLKIPITAMGNNMAVRKEAYFAVGGYENIPFSVTEDYALFKAVLTKKYDFLHLANKEVLGFTQPVGTLKDLLQQRRRWLGEFRNFPTWIKANIVGLGLYLPLLLLLAIIFPPLALIIFAIRSSIIYTLLAVYLYKTKQYSISIFLPIYDIFHLFFYFLVIINLFTAKNIVWKERDYQV